MCHRLILLFALCLFSKLSFAADPFNAALFESIIHNEMRGEAKGYAFVIVNRDGFQSRVVGGWAQDPADGNVRMSTKMPSCIGSVSKMLSGTALLQHFRSRDDGTVNEWLDKPIIDQLPPRWREAVDNSVLEITFRQLLQHKSGIRQADGTTEMKTNCKKMQLLCVLRDGIQPGDLNDRSYNNFNFKAITYLLPQLAYPNRCKEIRQRHHGKSLEAFSQAIVGEYKELYLEYMREEFFLKISASLRPSCSVVDELGAKGFAKSYKNVGDKTGTNINGCAAQGSWYISAEDLAQYACALAFSQKLQGPTMKGRILNPTEVDDRLLWNKVISKEALVAETGRRDWLYHGGTQQSYRAALVQLPFGFYGVGLINSEEKSSTVLANTLFDAFVRATRPGGSNPVYHGMTAAKYQQVSTELAKHDTRINRFDFYEAGGKVFVNARFTPAKGKDWVAKHGQTSAEYQALYEKYRPKGYRPTWVDSYRINGKTRYAVVMVKENNGNSAKHGLTLAQFQEQLKTYRRDNYEPLVVSGVGTSNGRRFTVLARPKRGDWKVKGAVPANKLEEVMDQSAEKGLYPHSIDAYRINGEQRYAVVFRERAKPIRYKEGLSAADYQGFYEGIKARGHRVTTTVGYVTGGRQRFGMLYAQ